MININLIRLLKIINKDVFDGLFLLVLLVKNLLDSIFFLFPVFTERFLLVL